MINGLVLLTGYLHVWNSAWHNINSQIFTEWTMKCETQAGCQAFAGYRLNCVSPKFVLMYEPHPTPLPTSEGDPSLQIGWLRTWWAKMRPNSSRAGPSSTMTGTLKTGKSGKSLHARKATQRLEVGCHKPKNFQKAGEAGTDPSRHLWREHGPASTLTVDFWPPEMLRRQIPFFLSLSVGGALSQQP